ncbi:hypothetical protein [Asanoa hainanensis]|nr:hypothetical protein [Asanoa hainanensis]
MAFVGFFGGLAFLVNSNGNFTYLMILGGISLLASTGAGWLSILEYGPRQRNLAAREEADQELNDAFGDAVAELLREIILERTPEEQSWGSAFNSQYAPTLVGIGVDQAVSSSTYTELSKFIADHPTSAIGIAGPRGVGKSTLMEKLIAGRRDVVGVRIPAPKRYEPGALIRLIHGTIAQEILHPGAGIRATADLSKGRRRLMRRVGVGILFVAIAIGILFVWSIDQEKRTYDSSPGWRVSTLTVLCIAAGGIWLGLFIRSLWSTLWSLRHRFAFDSGLATSSRAVLQRLAREELEYLRYTTTTQAKGGMRLKTGFFTLSGEDQLTLAEREPNEADSAERLRQFLRDVTRIGDRPVILGIDELDKMDKPEDVVAVVNSIKDLFHIRGVHVLVSVSTDAMHSFAARGVIVRDVFDSAFDTVVEVRRLGPTESADLLARRATAFSFPAMYFCHAWSGGHPRDLIRAARSCVTLSAEEKKVLPLSVVVDHVLSEDILALLRATVDRLRSDTHTVAAVEDLIAFRDLLREESGALHNRIQSALKVATLPVIEGPVTEGSLMVQTLLPYLELAALTSVFFSVARGPRQWKKEEIEQTVSELAAAQASMSSHPMEAIRATRRVRASVERSLLADGGELPAPRVPQSGR